jgi:hypothetical protein
MLHVQDPRLMPARTYLDSSLRWHNVSAVHMAAQMTTASDFARLYGGCNDQVLAFSHVWAAFDGFATGSAEQRWFDADVHVAVGVDVPAVGSASAQLVRRLRRDTGKFTCMHLTDLDAAVLSSRSAEREADVDPIDVAAPAAHSILARGHVGGRTPTSICDGYDAEAESPVGRTWVQQLYERGFACTVDDDVVAANLPRLPPRDPVFVLADGQRALPEAIIDGAALALKAEFVRLSDLLALVRLDARHASPSPSPSPVTLNHGHLFNPHCHPNPRGGPCAVRTSGRPSSRLCVRAPTCCSSTSIRRSRTWSGARPSPHPSCPPTSCPTPALADGVSRGRSGGGVSTRISACRSSRALHALTSSRTALGSSGSLACIVSCSSFRPTSRRSLAGTAG